MSSLNNPDIATGNAVFADANGNTITTGSFRGTVDFDPGPGVYNLTTVTGLNIALGDIYVTKLDAAGNFVWAKQMTGVLPPPNTNDYDDGRSITADANGNVYVTGYFRGTTDFDPGPGVFNLISAGPEPDIFVLKLDVSGNFVWAKQFGSTFLDKAYSIAVDASGNVYTTGNFSLTVDFDPGPGTYNLTPVGPSAFNADVFILKLDPSGNFVWAKQMGGTFDDGARSLALDAIGNVYLTGYTKVSTSNTGDNDITITKLDVAGNIIWTRQLGGNNNFFGDEGTSVAVDANGNVYTTGYFSATCDFDPGPGVYNKTALSSIDAFVLKLDAAGNFVWAAQFGGTGFWQYYDMGYVIKVDANNDVYSIGYYNATVDFDPGPGTYYLASANNANHLYVSKLSAAGNFVWAIEFDLPNYLGDFEGYGFDINSSGDFFIAGYFNGTHDFDAGPGVFNMTTAASRATYVAKYTQSCTTPIIPALNFTANPSGVICAGTPVTFTATASNTGGGTINYDFKVNGVSVQNGASNTFTTTTLANGNTVTCDITISGGACLASTTASSNTITMAVNPTLIPAVNITASPPGPVCAGTPVTFTATPTNGGTIPVYQWQVNGINVGTNAPTYSNPAVVNGDIVNVIMTSNANCASPTTATSNSITMVVTATITPSVGITASATIICTGTSVTFTATPTNGGSAPSYQWQVNGVNVGTNTITYSSFALVNGDIVKVIMTSNLSCASPTSATSNTISMTVNPNVTPTVNITANPSGAICAGTSVTFTATPTNGGAAPSYQWQVNGVNVGTNTATYSSTSLVNADIVKVIITSNENCALPTTATSNSITMQVNPILVPAVNISANPPGTICSGTSVTFTATPVNGGNTPVYQWKVNGVNVGTNAATFTTTTLTNGDIVDVILTSNATCATPSSATSNAITMNVTATLAPSVTINASATTICAGTAVTFTTTPTNGGATPSYQWKLNGINVGTNSPLYTTNTLANGDLVTVVMTSSLACASPASATSNSITMVVNPNVTPGVNIAANPPGPVCAGTSVTFTATASNTAGGSVNYDFKVNGTSVQNSSSNTYTSATLTNGNTVTCDITVTGGNCLTSPSASSNTITMLVNPNLTPAVNITANPPGSICSGIPVTFTAIANNTGGGTVNYDFKVNGTSVQNGASNTFTSSTLTNGNSITCDISITGGNCMASTTASSNTINMNVTATVIPAVSISASATNICSGTSVTFTAGPTNGGVAPTYQWQVNGINVGTNLPAYTSASLANADIVIVIMTSNAICASPTTSVSNNITMVVNPNISPAISITASPAGPVCIGSSVMFTATATNSGGGTVNYNFKVNGTSVQNSASNTYTSTTLTNGNTVTCDITITGGNCLTSTAAASNSITMNIALPPAITIVANPDGNICAGTSVNFTAAPLNTGTNPSFQWQVNGVNTGTNSMTYFNSGLVNGDKVNCIMNTVSVCSATPNFYSDTITMVVKPIPVISFNPDNPTIFSGNPIQLNAQTNVSIADYLWSPSTGLNNPAIQNPVANPANTTVYKLAVNSNDNCHAEKTITVTVIKEIYIPNSFTPNGDGINDIFRVPPGILFTLQYFVIYDRYGNEIFRTTDINKGWDGTYKGARSPNGTYTYLIMGSDSKREILLNGTVLIIR